MAVYDARGVWPGEAEGRIFWVDAEWRPERAGCADRPAEIGRLREAVSRALADLDDDFGADELDSAASDDDEDDLFGGRVRRRRQDDFDEDDE